MALPSIDPHALDFVRLLPNLADASLGAVALSASDEFFAPRDRMLQPTAAVFRPGEYDAHGKWMDGWETRRKRVAGHDWCIVRLAYPGTLSGVDFDTSHFTGNYPPAASLEGASIPSGEPDADTVWHELLPPTSLQGNQHHYLPLLPAGPVTHVRVNLFPDGGLARLRLYGRPVPDWQHAGPDGLFDLAALQNGGQVIATNNEHFGLASTLLRPGRGVNMGDGWETRRRREPGHDWCIIALGRAGKLQRIEVDTAHFRGNFPDRCSLQAASIPGATAQSIIPQSMFWATLLPEQPLKADSIHTFELADFGAVTHVRFNIHPDGGVSRLRLWGALE